MPLTPEQRDVVATELKKLVGTLNLSDDQKQKLQNVMSDASEKLQDYEQRNPSASRDDFLKMISDNRATIRQRVTSFLTPDQLAKWDAEVAKAKEFLGWRLAA